ncbi:helix-turn-helix transcriptional regulator [Sporosarcina luteola]|uniref:helix-turn-helix transcriptional regulator n=1 Tax=Sporosarcina luteola TaxID=582850 RepID=UPI00203AA2A8|nr:helix-turn-helix transcriptional regulator [Sporosarcina luteola]MCM3745335.1 helix-turn-helix transcriptional regulator [Sporosarcina luteola]
MNLGKRIKNIRESKGLTQEDIFTGIVSNSHYSNIESGRYNAAIETIKLIAKRLDVPEDYLISTKIDCKETQNLLDKLKLIVENGNVLETNSFLNPYKDKFDYISSLKQEACYQLLSFLHLFNSKKFGEAIRLYENYLTSAKQEDFEGEYKLVYLYATGLYYYIIKSHEKSITFFKELLKNSDDTSTYKPRVLYNIAMSLYNTYKYSEAIEYAKESKMMYLKLHDWGKAGDCYNLLVVLNREIKKYSIAESYLKKGFEIVKPDSFELLAKLHHNFSLICYDQGRYKEALEHINKSIKIKNVNAIPRMFVSYKLKLNILLNIDDLLTLNKTLNIASECITTPIHEAQYLYIEGNKHYILGDIERYECNIKKAINILQEQKSWKELVTVAENYSSFLEKNKRYKKALELQKLSNLAMKNIYEEVIS